MTTHYNAQNAKRLHELGIEFCMSNLKCTRQGQRIYLSDGSEVQVRTQNTMGEAFTIWVPFTPDFATRLKRSAHLFVNYGDTGTVSAHYLEKPDDDTYTMSLVGRDTIALVFKAEKCTELISIDDHEIWNEFRKYSSCRKYNLNSPHYAA